MQSSCRLSMSRPKRCRSKITLVESELSAVTTASVGWLDQVAATHLIGHRSRGSRWCLIEIAQSILHHPASTRIHRSSQRREARHLSALRSSKALATIRHRPTKPLCYQAGSRYLRLATNWHCAAYSQLTRRNRETVSSVTIITNTVYPREKRAQVMVKLPPDMPTTARLSKSITETFDEPEFATYHSSASFRYID